MSLSLYEASQEGNVEEVQLLLAKDGVEVNQAATYGKTPLYSASKNGAYQTDFSICMIWRLRVASLSTHRDYENNKYTKIVETYKKYIGCYLRKLNNIGC